MPDAEIASKRRCGADYVAVTIVATVAAVDVLDAFGLGTFRETADGDRLDCNLSAATAATVLSR